MPTSHLSWYADSKLTVVWVNSRLTTLLPTTEWSTSHREKWMDYFRHMSISLDCCRRFGRREIRWDMFNDETDLFGDAVIVSMNVRLLNKSSGRETITQNRSFCMCPNDIHINGIRAMGVSHPVSALRWHCVRCETSVCNSMSTYLIWLTFWTTITTAAMLQSGDSWPQWKGANGKWHFHSIVVYI